MLTQGELKNWLQRSLSQVDKTLLILGSLHEPTQLSEVRAIGRKCGLREIGNWNLSLILGRARGLAISTPEGWELTGAGREHLSNLGVATLFMPSRQEILQAVDALSYMGHSAFDRMLLEFGIEGIKADREVGSLASRSNALARFVLAQPTVKTAEGIPIAVAVVGYARRVQGTGATQPLLTAILDLRHLWRTNLAI